MLNFAPHAQQVLRGERHFRPDAGARGFAFGVHRHPIGTGGSTIAEYRCSARRSIQRCRTAGSCAIPVALVGAEIHVVIDLFIVCTRLQRAPVELAEIAQVHALLVVVEHIHALIRVELVRHVLNADFSFEQVIVFIERQSQAVVARLIGGGANFVVRQGMPDATGEIIILEISARGVIVGLAGRAAIADARPLGGIGGRNIGAARLVVAAVESTNLTLGDGTLPGRCKFRYARLGDNRPADAVTPHAHRRNTRINLERFNIAWIDIGQRRIHVVGAG